MPNNPGGAWIHNNGYDDAISTTAIGHNAVQQRFPEREGERHEIFLVRFSIYLSLIFVIIPLMGDVAHFLCPLSMVLCLNQCPAGTDF